MNFSFVSGSDDHQALDLVAANEHGDRYTNIDDKGNLMTESQTNRLMTKYAQESVEAQKAGKTFQWPFYRPLTSENFLINERIQTLKRVNLKFEVPLAKLKTLVVYVGTSLDLPIDPIKLDYQQGSSSDLRLSENRQPNNFAGI